MTRKKITDPYKREKGNLAGKIAVGATGVAITAAAIAAGAALAHKETRQKFGRTIKGAANTLQDLSFDGAEEVTSRYQAVAHKIAGGKKGSSRKKTRSKK